MTTLLQIFAVAMIGLTVGAWMAAGLGVPDTRRNESRTWMGGVQNWLQPHARGLGIAVAVIATFFFWTQLWNFWVARSGERRAFSNLPSEVARYQDASLGNSNQPFLEFVRSKLKPGDTFALVPDHLLNGSYQHQWITYALSPNMLVDPEDADLLIGFNREPMKIDWDDERFSQLQFFDADNKYWIARHTDAR